jgi:hypothetical protein
MLLRIVPQFAHPDAGDGGKLRASVTFWIFKILYILFSLIGGVALVWLPWCGFWENNNILYILPQIRPVIANPYFKGAVLGLGLVNIALGIGEIARLLDAAKRSAR